MSNRRLSAEEFRRVSLRDGLPDSATVLSQAPRSPSPPRDLRLGSLAVLGACLIALAGWRVVCVLAGPDIDTDAYAHHMIARAILADPRDLAVHWVWLPLFHYLQVPLVALGGTLDAVRWANIVLGLVVPVVLYAYVERTTRSGESRLPPQAVALVAALTTAACPIVMQMSTTGQPELLFALLMLGVAIAVQRGRPGWTAALLGAAVLLRYEAWAAIAVVALFVAWQRGRGWVSLAVPITLILLWAALRRPVDGQWFAFLRQTKEFANDALHQKSGVLGDLLYYPVRTAYRVMGPVLPLSVLGIARTVRQQGARFVLVLSSCLGFVSLTWVTRSSLGLDRHFVCVVPLYATFAGQGVAVTADAVTRWSRRATLGRAIAASVAMVCLAGLLVHLEVWMGFWKASIVRGWPERTSAAAYLDGLPSDSTIFCDDATLELLTHVDRRRFDRHWIDDPQTWRLVHAAARAGRTAYVATWRRKLIGHEPEGNVVFASGVDPSAPATTGLAVMRVEP